MALQGAYLSVLHRATWETNIGARDNQFVRLVIFARSHKQRGFVITKEMDYDEDESGEDGTASH